MTEIEMFINMRIQTFFVQKVGVMGVSKYTFNELSTAELSDFVVDRRDARANKADPRFIYCFKIQVKNNPQKVVACASIEERDQWLRCFRMIIEMRNLGIDSGRVNIFTFEQYRKY